MQPYNPTEIEPKWQAYWRRHGLAQARAGGPKQTVIMMFPYPSGDLHVGHLKNYTLGDVLARFKKQQGYAVLHAMGWDAFGLPAENAALKEGVHPVTGTFANIAKSKASLRLSGIEYDWDREVTTCTPEYYRWNQWLFLKLYEHGLAYRAVSAVNWCPRCQTVLANEQVVNGRCWRHEDTLVDRRQLEQWYFRITAYADRLLEGLERLPNWPEKVRAAQRAWIGRSPGAEIDFAIAGHDAALPVFTTRPDTLFGATFLVMAPEHPLTQAITAPERKAEVEAYVQAAQRKSEIERLAERGEKTGVFTGAYAVPPGASAAIPIYVADYVLASYGSGAVMGVPAHDQRDFEFARQFGLPMRVVIQPEQGDLAEPLAVAYTGAGRMVASGPLTGTPAAEAIPATIAWLEAQGRGRGRITYRIRDWLISRQRYWGTPIPMIHCPVCGIVPVPHQDLPVVLPDIEDLELIRPQGRSPLAAHPDFMAVVCPQCGGPAQRDPDTIDTFVDSAWYFLRFTDPHNTEAPFRREPADYWLPIDRYIGGVEHQVLHLLYARFITHFFYDMGMVGFEEPFDGLFTLGMLLGWTDFGPVEVEGERVIVPESLQVRLDLPAELTMERLAVIGAELRPGPVGADGIRPDGIRPQAAPHFWKPAVLSKSLGNGPMVGDFVQRYGADVARITILFAGPPEAENIWSERGVVGAARFLDRVWARFQADREALLAVAAREPDADTLPAAERNLCRNLHQTIARITDGLEGLRFNTAIAHLMSLLNEFNAYRETQPVTPTYRQALQAYLQLLAPFAPHIAEELWSWFHAHSLPQHPWPQADPAALVQEEVELAVQVNGRVRGRLAVAAGLAEAEILQRARELDNVQRHLDGRRLVREVYVPGRLINFVIA